MTDHLIFRFVFSIFACYRLARLMAIDVGPLAIFDKIRAYFGRLAARGGQASWAHNFAEGLNCPHCLGVWFALPLAFFVSDKLTEIMIIWLAIAGAQSFMWGVTTTGEE